MGEPLQGAPVTLPFAESVVEEAALTWLQRLGYQVLHGPAIDPWAQFAEREDPAQVVLARRLLQPGIWVLGSRR